MTTAKERLEQAERRLQEVEGLQHVLEQAAHELANYRLVLERKLAWLGQGDGRPAAPVAPGRSAGTQRMATVQAVPGTQRLATVKPPAPPPPSAAPAPPPVVRAKPTPPKLTRPSHFRSQPPPEPEAVPEVEEVKKAPPHPASAAFEADDDDDGSERRTAPRRKGNPVPVKLSDPTSNTEPLDGWVVDRSSGGVRILTDQSFKPGAQLTIRPAKSHAGFPWIKIEVRSCSPERGSFSLGCMFQQKPSWAELQGFG
jgi:hypothetical protein